MAMVETWYNQDLQAPVQVQYLDGNVFSQDNLGNLIGVHVFDDGEPAVLSGSVSGNVIRQDGGTVAVTGTLSGNDCYIILPEAAYSTPGPISIIIKFTGGGSTTTLCAVVANVYQSSTEAAIDPGTVIPSIADLITEIENAIATIPPDYASLTGIAKTNGLLFSDANKIEHLHYTDGAYRYYADGEIRSNSDYSYSDYFTVIPGSYITLTNTSNPHITFYDESYSYVGGSLSMGFVVPSDAVYMVLSIPTTDKSVVTATWSDNRMIVKQIIITDASVLTDFDDAEWNKIYSFSIGSASYWDSIENIPTKANGTLITIDTNNNHYAGRQIYITVDCVVFVRFYIPSTESFSDWKSGFGVCSERYISNVSELPDFNNAEWNRWYIFNLSDSAWGNVSHKPIAENGTLLTLDTNYNHYAGRHIYITNSGNVYVRFFIPSSGTFTDWVSQNAVNAKKVGVLYDEFLTSENASDFAGTFTATANGFEITTNAILGKFYSIENRTVAYLCKVFSDSVVSFCTAPFTDVSTINTSVVVDIGNKTVKLNDFPSESCSFLSGGSILCVELSKHYQKFGIKITNMTTGDVFYKEYINNGAGGAGEGAIGTANNIPMQYDYYGIKKVSGTSVLLVKMCVKCDVADVVLYGDSITEPEAYWPTEDFENSWTKMLIDQSSQKVVTSGRSGSSIVQITERIKNELPYLNAKYCVITIGTNGGNTEERLTALVEYIKSLGVVPILNHIPCYNNNGDTTGFRSINAVIDTVRANMGVKGCNFDLCTSLNYDGQNINTDMMWLETYSGGAVYYHHPNEKGSAAMLAQLRLDVPEIF